MERVEAAVAQGLVEGGPGDGVELGGVEVGGVLQAGGPAVGGERGVGGEPGQPLAGARLGGPCGGVGGGESDPALVGDEPGVAGLVAFEGGVVEVGEDVGGECGVVESGVGGEGGAELADEVTEGGSVEPQEVPGPDEEGVRILECGRAPEGARHDRCCRCGRRGWRWGQDDRVRGDVPTAVRAAPGAEAEAAAVVEGQGPGVPCGGRCGDGADDLLVGELAEHLGKQPAGGEAPGPAVEFGRRAEVPGQRRPGGVGSVGGCGEVRHVTPRRSGTLLRYAELSRGEVRSCRRRSGFAGRHSEEIAQHPLPDHQGGPLLGKVDFRGAAETGVQEG